MAQKSVMNVISKGDFYVSNADTDNDVPNLIDRENRTSSLPILLQYWRIASRWWLQIASIVIACIVVGAIVTLLTTPRYTATSMIEISRQKENIVNVKGVEPEVSTGDLEFYQTQYSLLRAKSLAIRVANDLRLAGDDQFFDTFRIKTDDAGLFGAAPSGKLDARQRAERENIAVGTLLNNISISPIRGSSLVEVQFTSPDPVLSARVANAWTAGFITSNLDRRFESASYARKFLEDRLEQLRRRLEESERAVVAYASNQRIISVAGSGEGGAGSAERSLVTDDLSRLNAELAQSTADRIKAGSRSNGVNGTSSEALTNSAITALRQKRGEAAGEYARLLTKFEPEYPTVRAVASQIAALDQSIAREAARVQSGINSEFRDAEKRETALKRQVERLKESAIDLRRRSIQYNIYQRESDTNRQLYDGLLQRYKEIGIAGGVGTNNVLVVDVASVPEKPTSPRLVFNMALALLAGLVIAAATVFALEQIDEVVKDPTDVADTLGVSMLGTVPTVIDGKPELALVDRKSAISEAYLSIQTNLKFVTDHGVPKTLAVTSTRAAEGKSTTCYALAQTLARTGHNVIIVDCDMRSPSVHHLLGIENKRGVSDFLAGDDALETLIVAAEKSTPFDAMTAGPQPPNAAELLTSSRLAVLLERLSEAYDHVLVDSPPVLGLADAPLIGGQVEGIVYAVQAHGVRARMVKAALKRLRDANVHLAGVVLTKFDAKRAHYGYGYDYGYGYGQRDTEAEG
jgi:polysaccharide biosynthesis transport protein